MRLARTEKPGAVHIELPEDIASHESAKVPMRPRREMWEDIAEHADDDTVGTIRPQKALWDVRQVLGPNDILLSDVGARVLSSCRSATGRTRC